MKILIYIAKRVNVYFIALLTILLSIDLIFSLINEIKAFIHQEYLLRETLLFVILAIPRKAYALTPWVAMLATLLSLGSIAKNSELTILQVSGLSPWKIASMVIISSLPLLILLFICGEVVAPKTDRMLMNARARGVKNTDIIATDDGVWARHENNFIQIMNIPNKNNLEDITIFTIDDNLKIKSITTASNALKNYEEWELNNTKTTTIQDDHIELAHKDKIFYKNFINPNVLSSYKSKHIERLSLTKLYSIIKQRASNHLPNKEYQVALWKKLVQPLTNIVMILLAVPLTFSSLRKSPIGAKVVIGVLIGFAIHILNSIFYSFAVLSNINIIVLSLIPNILILIASVFFFRRINK